MLSLRPGLGVYVDFPVVRGRCPLRLSRNLLYRTRMAWQPITDEGFVRVLAEERASFSAEAHELMSRFGIEPRRVQFQRFGDEPEAAFIVAQSGRVAVLFDDVEELFGCGILNAEATALDKWWRYGPLQVALRELARDAAFHQGAV